MAQWRLFILSILGVSTLTGCAQVMGVTDFLLTGNITTYISEDDAVKPFIYAKERYRQKQVVSNKSEEKLFVQPINKKEKCLIPADQNAIKGKGYRQYWDGACKDGFAYGLGRDITFYDNSHIEEIVNHDINRKGAYGPSIYYDFKRRIVYRTYYLGEYGGSNQRSTIEFLLEDDDSAYRKRTEFFMENGSFAIKNIDEVEGSTLYELHEEGIIYGWMIPEGSPNNILRVEIMIPEGTQNIKSFPFRQIYKNGSYKTGIHNKNGSNDLVDFVNSDNTGKFDYWSMFAPRMYAWAYELDSNTYINDIKELERNYFENLNTQGKKGINGIKTSEYLAIKEFYTRDFLWKVQNTQLKLLIAKQKREIDDLKQTFAILQKTASHTTSIDIAVPISPATIPTIKPIAIQPLKNYTGPSIYRAQRVNDNIISLQRVK